MNWRGHYLRVFWIWAVVAPWFGYGQVPAQGASGIDAGSSQTVESALHGMSDRADVIFVGTVAAVHRTEPSGVAPGFVEVRFVVDQAIRGCSGSAYTLREWAGLWSANDARYHPGQRLLMLLHAPGATGLSSPVDGMDGAVPLRASGAGVSPSSTSQAAAEPVADLRWVGAKVSRSVIYRSPQPSPAALPRTSSSNAIAPSAAPIQTPSTLSKVDQVNQVSQASTPAQEAAVSVVVAMLRSWKAGSDATR